MKVCSFVEKSAKDRDDDPSWFTSKFLLLNLGLLFPQLWILNTGLRARTTGGVLMSLGSLNIFSVFHPLCGKVVTAQFLYDSICECWGLILDTLSSHKEKGVVWAIRSALKCCPSPQPRWTLFHRWSLGPSFDFVSSQVLPAPAWLSGTQVSPQAGAL